MEMGCLLFILLIHLSVVTNPCGIFSRFILEKKKPAYFATIFIYLFLQTTFLGRNTRQFLIEVLDTLRAVLEGCWEDGDIYLVTSNLQVQVW